MIEQLIKILTENIEDFNIQYSNVNGKEQLFVNGKEIVFEEEFDDSKIKDQVKKYKDIYDSIDDCLFMEIIDDISEDIDLKTFNELLDQESYTENEAQVVEQMINYSNNIIKNHVDHKIQNLTDLLNRI